MHEQIKKRRLALKLSQTDLAVRVSKLEGLPRNLTYAAVQQWEKEGGTAPKHKRLQHVAAALDTTVQALLDGDAQPGSNEPEGRWPLQSISLEELRELSPAKLEQIDQILAALIGTDQPPDWRSTAQALATELDRTFKQNQYELFVSTVDKHHLERQMEYRQKTHQPGDTTAATPNKSPQAMP